MDSKIQAFKFEKAKLLLELEQKESPILLLRLGKVIFEISKLQKKELRKIKNHFEEI